VTSRRTAAALLLTLATLALAGSAAAYDPALRWRTIQTEHFNIHYHQGETLLAYKGARVFEEVYALLTVELGRELHRKRMDVVIVDSTDDANGYALSQPYPAVVLFATAPMARESLQGYDDWLWAIFVHEYTHILHIDTTEGINRVWRALFGGWYKPNRLLPGWMIEGYAVYNESIYTGGGRNRSAWADMLVRMSVLENRFPDLGQADGYVDDWPGGYLRYIWGGRFHRWVADQHDPLIWTEMNHRAAAQAIPFVIPARKVFGSPMTELWKGWEADLELQYRGLQRELMLQGLTDAELLTPKPDFGSYPEFSGDGEWIYHGLRHYRGPSTIRRMRPDGSEAETLSRHWNPQGLTVSADGSTLYFAAMRPHALYYDFYDLYRLDVDGKRPWRRQRLTHGARARDPDLHPDEDRLVCVVNGLANNDLAIWTEAGGLRRITAVDDYTQFADPAWSPDGTRIAVSTWLTGGYRDILIFDEAGQQLARITEDRAIDNEPSWSPDGAFLLFSSDRSGIYNIYAHRLEDGVLFRATNVIAGAFRPTVSPDGQWLLYEGYTSHGTDIRRTPYDPGAWVRVEDDPPPPPPETLPPPPPVEVAIEPSRYNPWPTLAPQHWRPIVEKHDDGTWTDWTLGGRTNGRDILRMHEWSAEASYRTGYRFFSWAAAYELTALRPNIRVGYYNYALSRGRIWLDHAHQPAPGGAGLDGIYLGEDRYLERRDRAYLRVSLPLHARHSVWARYEFDWHSPLSEIPEDAYAPLLPGVGSYSNLEMGYSFSQTRGYRFSVSREAGFQGGIKAQLVYPWLGAAATDWTGEPIVQSRTVVSAEARAYLSMPWWRNHVLALRGAGGTTFGQPLETGSFRLGGHFPEGSNLGSPSSGYPLRGYSSGAYSGDRLALLSVEYRLPLVAIQRGVGVIPLYARGVHLAAAFDIGQVWREGDYPSPAQIAAGDATLGQAIDSWMKGLRPGVALEVHVQVIPFWNGLLNVRMGYQSSIGDRGIKFGEDSFYLHLGSSF